MQSLKRDRDGDRDRDRDRIRDQNNAPQTQDLGRDRNLQSNGNRQSGQQQQFSTGGGSGKVHVSGLGPLAVNQPKRMEKDLQAMFNRVGVVKNVKIPLGVNINQPVNYAFVEFVDGASVAAAVAAMNGKPTPGYGTNESNYPMKVEVSVQVAGKRKR